MEAARPRSHGVVKVFSRLLTKSIVNACTQSYQGASSPSPVTMTAAGLERDIFAISPEPQHTPIPAGDSGSCVKTRTAEDNRRDNWIAATNVRLLGSNMLSHNEDVLNDFDPYYPNPYSFDPSLDDNNGGVFSISNPETYMTQEEFYNSTNIDIDEFIDQNSYDFTK